MGVALGVFQAAGALWARFNCATLHNCQSPSEVEHDVVKIVQSPSWTRYDTIELGHNKENMMNPSIITNRQRGWRALLYAGLLFSLVALATTIQFTHVVAGDEQDSRLWTPNGSRLEAGAWGARLAEVSELSAIQFTSVVAGDEHTCGLTAGGGVTCWGGNSDGQAGDGTTYAYRPAVNVTGLPSGVQAIAANGGHTCVVLGGTVSCWGRNSFGQLGDGSVSERRVPIPVLGLVESATALAAGANHTCALLQSGTVACWGRNAAGQLGNGANVDQKTPVAVTSLGGLVTKLVAGANHTCALLQSGAMQCWGDNANGQLGDGGRVARALPTTVAALAGSVISLAAGSDHTCAILADGRVQCWGDNARGQLGDGSREDRLNPTVVSDLRDAAATIAAGHFHTCVLAVDGDLYCWGTNSRGQLGNGTLESSRIPVRVIGAPGDAAALTAGVDHNCAIFKAKAVYCWGSNRARQLGQGAPAVATVPQLIQPAALENGAAPLQGIPAIVAGRYHTCLITPSHTVQCWGRNSDGQVGDGTQLPQTQPINVSGLTGVTALTLGVEHTCALLQNGAIQCWGSNGSGQLGDGTTTEHFTPKAVSGLAGTATALAAGDSHTCALLQPGSVQCWGANNVRQLGNGTNSPASSPVNVAGLSSGVIALTAGATHSCALLQGGGVKCWGDNALGQLGDGTSISRTLPVDVIGLAGAVIALDAGGSHTCAVLSDGTVQCWGANNSAQLGDGTRIGKAQPVTVSGLPGRVTAVGAGSVHTCALLTEGGVFCWGGNENSQLGDGTAEDRLTPVGVSGLSANVLSLTAGGYHTCVLVTGNRPLCWGRDSDGQLATGVIIQSPTLVTLEEMRTPKLVVNYATAQPGSTLTLIGSGFPVSSTLPLVVNGVTISGTLSVNPSGELIVYVTTQAATDGAYVIGVGNPPSATVFFLLQTRAELHPAEGGGVTFALPAGIGQPVFDRYMPLIRR